MITKANLTAARTAIATTLQADMVDFFDRMSGTINNVLVASPTSTGTVLVTLFKRSQYGAMDMPTTDLVVLSAAFDTYCQGLGYSAGSKFILAGPASDPWLKAEVAL